MADSPTTSTTPAPLPIPEIRRHWYQRPGWYIATFGPFLAGAVVGIVVLTVILTQQQPAHFDVTPAPSLTGSTSIITITTTDLNSTITIALQDSTLPAQFSQITSHPSATDDTVTVDGVAHVLLQSTDAHVVFAPTVDATTHKIKMRVITATAGNMPLLPPIELALETAIDLQLNKIGTGQFPNGLKWTVAEIRATDVGLIISAALAYS